MPARSVAELLPVRFETLGLDDVREILRRVGDFNETLFFEKKATLAPDSLAKACASFANSFGGLLLVGIPNDSDDLVGIDPIGEAQLRVKDILRERVLPRPAFQARWLAVGDQAGKGLRSSWSRSRARRRTF